MSTPITTDHPDWQASASYNQLLASNTQFNIANGTVAVNLPVAAYQSLRIICVAANTGIYLRLRWNDSAVSTPLSVAYIWPVNTGAPLDVTVPCDGPYVIIDWINGGTSNTTSTVKVYGITRPVPRPTYPPQILPNGINGEFIAASGVNTHPLYVISGGRAMFSFDPGGAGAHVFYQLFTMEIDSSAALIILNAPLPTVMTTINLVIPATGIVIRITNTDPANAYQISWTMTRLGS